MARRRGPDTRYDRFALVAGLFRSAGQVISRHPSIIGGATVFAVAFAFVSINALVNQPGRHPAPLYETRAPVAHSVRLPAPEDVPVPSSRISTFHTVDSDPQSTASIPTGNPRSSNKTVYNLQHEMRVRGLYRGDVDGVFGPQTADAIRAYQKGHGLEATGVPSDALLVHILISQLDTVAVPRPKPKTIAKIIAADQPVRTTQPPARPAEPEAEIPVADLVISIQRGLSNIAYDDVRVDGVIGRQTSEAIADFQRHYRLPVTGKPDRIVLKKLREIGAL